MGKQFTFKMTLKGYTRDTFSRDALDALVLAISALTSVPVDFITITLVNRRLLASRMLTGQIDVQVQIVATGAQRQTTTEQKLKALVNDPAERAKLASGFSSELTRAGVAVPGDFELAEVGQASIVDLDVGSAPTPTPDDLSSSSSSAGMIAGVVVAALVVIALVVFAVVKRKPTSRRPTDQASNQAVVTNPAHTGDYDTSGIKLDDHEIGGINIDGDKLSGMNDSVDNI